MIKIISFTIIFFCCVQFAFPQAGKPDSSFGVKGIVAANLGKGFNYPSPAAKVLLKPDGSIYLLLNVGKGALISKRHPDGSADLNYGQQGRSSYAAIQASDAAFQQDGKIVIAGNSDGNFAVVRYNIDGTLDSLFGLNGKQTTTFQTRAEAYGVAIQGDNKIVVVGGTLLNTSDLKFAMVRYNNDGSLDKTFSQDGKAADVHGVGAGYSIAIQNDGKIVAAVAPSGSTITHFSLVRRYNTNGSADTSFNTNSLQISAYEDARSLAIQKDGKIVVAGEAFNASAGIGYFFLVARYNVNGKPDSSFSGDGKQYTTFGFAINTVNAVGIQTDGKIIAAGYTGNYPDYDIALARYSADGSLDTTFSGDGKQTTDISGGVDLAYSIALQSDHKIVMAGTSFIRYNKDGSVDDNFNRGDKSLTIVADNTKFTNTKIQRDGKIVAAGSAWNGANFDVVVTRYNTDGSVDNTFGNNGSETTSVGPVDNNVTSIGLKSDGKIVVATRALDSCGNFGCHYHSYILQYNTNGSLDNSFNKKGILRADLDISSIVIQKDNKIVAAGSSPYFIAIARYNIDGSLDNTFSEDGKQVTAFTDGDGDSLACNATSLTLQSDGKIVAGVFVYGTEGQYYGLVSYNINGSVNWKRSLFSDPVSGLLVAEQSDDKIIAAGSVFYRNTSQINIARINADGTQDNSFINPGNGSSGISDNISSIAIQKNDKIILGGTAISRYNKNGSLDSTFNGSGIQRPTATEGFLRINSVAIANDKLYAAGTGIFYDTVGIIARYLLDDNSQIPPIVSLVSPANNATYLSGANIYLIATAYDAQGAISKVQFYSDTTLLYTATDTPYTFKWTGVKKGNYILTAKATDNDGLVTTSLPVHISVLANTPPAVTITSPASGTNFIVPGPVFLSADASDSGGTIKSVSFYSDSTLLFTENKAPYSREWDSVPTGSYTITAVATDNTGLTTTSSPVHITVLHNRPPVVNITSPADSSSYTAPATIVLSADATAHGGKIKTVRFYNGTTLIHTEENPPYSWTWKDVPAGSFTVTAVATDSYKRTTTSAPVHFTVTPYLFTAETKSPESVNALSTEDIDRKATLTRIVTIQLVPNPARSILNINITGLQKEKQTTLSVISVSGVVVKTLQTSSSAQTVPLNVSSLVSGVYIIKIISGDKVMYKQFVKM